MNTQNHITESSREIDLKVVTCRFLGSKTKDMYKQRSLTVINVKNGEEETIELPNNELAQIFGQSGTVNEDAMNVVNMMLYIKDWYYVSDNTYHELAKVCSQMPRQYKLKENITPAPNGTHGVQKSKTE